MPILRFIMFLLACAVLPAQDYKRYAEVEQALKALAGKNPGSARIEPVGNSAGGLTIHALRIAAPGAVEPEKRPAVFVGANIVGYHNAGTEAALALAERLLSGQAPAGLLESRTFYIVPVLHPDGHDGLFDKVRRRIPGHARPIDRDLDGLEGEDGPDDLNGDGRITQMRIPDPAGAWLPDPQDPRRMIEADPLKGQKGQYRLYTEGRDDDGDGEYNEDAPDGIQPGRNFAHAYPYGEPEAGLFAGQAPETKAIMDYLLKRRNVALAFVFGPANNLLDPPRGIGGGADPSAARIRPPAQIANALGLDRNREYSIDEIWETARDLPLVRQQNLTKEQFAQFLGGGPATQPAAEDLKILNWMAESYKKRLEQGGLDSKRPARQYAAGGFTPWLYYQFATFAIELDVWGVPKAKAETKPAGNGLTLDALEKMSSEDFLNLSDERLGEFLKELNAPPMMTPAMLKGMVRSGQATPAQMAQRVRSTGGASRPPTGGGAASSDDLLAWIDANAPGAFTPWTPVTLPNGVKAEVGGADPFIEFNPPWKFLQPAIEAHVDTVIDAAGKLAELEIAEVRSEALGNNVWRVRAAARNRGLLPTHTQHATRARTYLPVRLEIAPGLNARLLHGRRFTVSERIEGGKGALEGEWIVQGPPGTEIRLTVTSDQAGSATATHRLGGQN